MGNAAPRNRDSEEVTLRFSGKAGGEEPLTLEEITTIVDLLLIDLDKRLADRRVTVKLDKKAKEWAAEKGYDPVFGARPLKRFLQRNLETKLARALIIGDVQERSDLTFTVRDDALAFDKQPAVAV